MDIVLNEKPKGLLKKWSIAGIVAVLAFFVLYVLIEMQSYQYITMMYGMEPSGMDIASDFLSINGLFSAAVLIFFIGLFTSKKRGVFIPFMLWTMLLTCLYFVMPKLASLVEIFFSLTGLQLMYYLGLILPQAILSALIVSFILQKDSANKKITKNIAWVTMIAGAALFVFQIIYSASQFSGADMIADISNLWGAIAIVVIICLAGVILAACKEPSLKKQADTPEDGTLTKNIDEQLDGVVEKIAQQVCKGDNTPAKGEAKDEN